MASAASALAAADAAEEPEPVAPSWDRDPANRRFDRLLAYMGLLNDDAARFRSGQHVPGAGVLLALPAVVATGVLTAARQVYGSIGSAFYGLRTTLLTLLLMALLFRTTSARSTGARSGTTWPTTACGSSGAPCACAKSPASKTATRRPS